MLIFHEDLADSAVFRLLRSGQITFGGNRRLKIYGRLDCSSGKRMNRSNRVFFADEAQALQAGYRPCGHCLPEKYREWKSSQGQTTRAMP